MGTKERRQRILEVVSQVTDQWLDGQPVDFQQILDRHPDLLPELENRLNALNHVCSARLAAQEANLPPNQSVEQRIPGYTILDSLPAGGQGLVYTAIQEATGREVALKLLHPGYAQNPIRFEREIHVLAHLSHPNIVSILDCGHCNGQPYIVMNLVAGEPIHRHLGQHDLPRSARLQLFLTICNAVGYAHLKGVVHRDIKPANILVTDDGVPIVLDFGLAKTTERDHFLSTDTVTREGDFLGTLPWASPEQIEGNGDLVDQRSDIYSLGVLLFHILTGELPFETKDSVREQLDTLAHAEPTKPSRHDHSIDRDLDTIVLKCLARDPTRRYQSIDSLSRDLDRYLSHEPIEARADSTLYVLGKLVRRHQRAFAVTFSFILLLGASAIISFSLLLAERATAAELAEERTHVDAEREAVERVFDFFTDNLIQPLTDGGRIHRDVTLFDAVLALADQVPESFPNEPLMRARVHARLGATYIDILESDAATSQFQQSWEIMKRELGPNDLQTIDAAQALARSLTKQDRHQEALELQQECLNLIEMYAPDQHQRRLNAMINLATKHHALGQLQEAIELLEPVLADHERNLGWNHSRTAHAAHNLAILYQDTGRFEDAERLFRSALNVYETPETKNLPGARSILSSLSENYQRTSRHKEAVNVLEGLVEMNINDFGANARKTIAARSMLALNLYHLGRFDEAESILQEVVPLATETLGKDALGTQSARGTLTLVLAELGKWEQVRDINAEIYESCLNRRGESNLHTMVALNKLSQAHCRLGAREEAVAGFERLMTTARTSLTENHWLVGHFKRCYGDCLMDYADWANAAPLLLSSYAILEEQMGPKHGRTISSIESLVRLYENWDKPEELEAWKERLAWASESDKKTDPQR